MSDRLRSINELGPEEVLMVAIDVEVANGEKLDGFAEAFSDYAPQVSSLFAEMASFEDDHTRRLEARLAELAE